MGYYLLKRLALYLPTLWIISVVIFLMSKATPGDPVEKHLYLEGMGEGLELDDDSYKKEYEKMARELNFHLPQFYFTLKPKSLSSISWPQIKWNGSNNQYHIWITNVVNGDFGNSSFDGKRVSVKVGETLPWTLYISISALLLSIAISIPAGVYLSGIKSLRRKRIFSILAYAFYSIPVFWLATLLVVFFTTAEYSSLLNIFPSIGVKPGANFWSSSGRMILPVLCLVIHSLAYLMIQMKNSMENQLVQPYIRTALSKGLDRQKVHWHHAFRNASLPIITILVGAIPGILAGSVIIEVIFNIPGMGRLMYESILSGDWNIVYMVLLLIGFLTLISYLIGDLLYRWSSPVIKFEKAKS